MSKSSNAKQKRLKTQRRLKRFINTQSKKYHGTVVKQVKETTPIATVLLKNGTTEAKPLVTVMMMTLDDIMNKKPILFYELVMKCRDKNHTIFGNMAQDLKDFSLMDAGGSIHQSIRNIVLSAAKGDGLDMALVNPTA